MLKPFILVAGLLLTGSVFAQQNTPKPIVNKAVPAKKLVEAKETSKVKKQPTKKKTAVASPAQYQAVGPKKNIEQKPKQ